MRDAEYESEMEAIHRDMTGVARIEALEAEVERLREAGTAMAVVLSVWVTDHPTLAAWRAAASSRDQG